MGPATVHVVEIVPVADVETSLAYVGDVHPTEIDVLIGGPSATVGWFGSLLHWRRLPIDPCEKPLPVTVRTVPFVTPVLGLSVSVPTAADAGIASKSNAAPVRRKSDAANWSAFTRRTRPDGVLGVTATGHHRPGGDELGCDG